MPPSDGGAGWGSPALSRELPDGALAAPGDAGDLARAVSLLGERAELPCSGWFGLGQRLRRAVGRQMGRGVACRRHPDVVGGCAEPGGDGPDGQAGADERVQVSGPDGVRVWAGPGMLVTHSNGGSQVTGSLMLALDSSARACWCRQKDVCSGMASANSA